MVAAGSGSFNPQKIDDARATPITPEPQAGQDPASDQASPAGWTPWKMISDVNPKGTRFCSIISMQKIKDKKDGRVVIIKKFDDSDLLDISIFKEGWGLPDGTLVKTIFNFSDNEPLTLTAKSEGEFLNLGIPKEGFALFLLALAQNAPMRVSFPQSTVEPVWVVDAANPHETVLQFGDCVRMSTTRAADNRLLLAFRGCVLPLWTLRTNFAGFSCNKIRYEPL